MFMEVFKLVPFFFVFRDFYGFMCREIFLKSNIGLSNPRFITNLFFGIFNFGLMFCLSEEPTNEETRYKEHSNSGSCRPWKDNFG